MPPEFSTSSARGSTQGLFSPQQIRRLMRIEFDRAQRYKYPVVFLTVAVDRLQQLQDLYGYQVKDTILGALVRMLKSATRSSDALGTLQDDRLLVLVPHTPPEGAAVMASRIRDGIKAFQFDCDGRPMKVTVSAGGAHNQHHPDLTFDTLLEVAEGGLAVALAGGGDRYVHSELYEFFQARREREGAVSPPPPESVPEARFAAPPPVAAPAPPPAPVAPVAPQPQPVAEAAPPLPQGPQPGQDRVSGELLGDKIRELFGLGNGAGDQGLLVQIEQQVIASALGELKGELRKSMESTQVQHKKEIELLQRRIDKLSRALGGTEGEIQRILRLKNVDSGVASIYRSVQGLSEDQVENELKTELMSKIFEANVELRKKFTSGD